MDNVGTNLPIFVWIDSHRRSTICIPNKGGRVRKVVHTQFWRGTCHPLHGDSYLFQDRALLGHCRITQAGSISLAKHFVYGLQHVLIRHAP